MIKIEVLGTGCAKCKRVLKNVEKAVSTTGIEADVKKIEDINEITSRGVFMTPGLVINGELKAMGRVPPVSEIIEMLKEADA